MSIPFSTVFLKKWRGYFVLVVVCGCRWSAGTVPLQSNPCLLYFRTDTSWGPASPEVRSAVLGTALRVPHSQGPSEQFLHRTIAISSGLCTLSIWHPSFPAFSDRQPLFYRVIMLPLQLSLLSMTAHGHPHQDENILRHARRSGQCHRRNKCPQPAS